MNCLVHVFNNSLHSLACELKRMKLEFHQIDFQHIYREWNTETNELSKVGLSLDENVYILEE